MSIRTQEFPEFAQSLRGYDRPQVDGYLERLREYTIEVEDRALSAEQRLTSAHEEIAELRRQLAASGGGELPDRLAHILDLAQEEAETVRARARAEANELDQRCRAQLDETRTRATADAKRMVADSIATRDAIARELGELEQVRREHLDELAGLCAHLAEMVQRHRHVAESSEPTQAIRVQDAAAG
jgi:cell division septum initiation protein DivIVA